MSCLSWAKVQLKDKISRKKYFDMFFLNNPKSLLVICVNWIEINVNISVLLII